MYNSILLRTFFIPLPLPRHNNIICLSNRKTIVTATTVRVNKNYKRASVLSNPLTVLSFSSFLSANKLNHHQHIVISNRLNSILSSLSSVISLRFNTITNMAQQKPKVVFVLGAPGAGKGTQCTKIVNEYGYVHLSAGDLLREERQRPGSEFGELIEDCIKNGKIVPVEVTCSLINNAMNKYIQEEGKYNFLIDGFPRNQDNVDGWTRVMSSKTSLQFVLVFDCSEDVCIERCLNRGAAGSGRSDDNLESLKKRFNTFYVDSLPIIEHYEAKNLVAKIDGTSNPNEIFEKVKKVFTDKASADAAATN